MSMPRSRSAMRKVTQGRVTNLAVVIVIVDLLVAGIFYNFTHTMESARSRARQHPQHPQPPQHPQQRQQRQLQQLELGKNFSQKLPCQFHRK